MPHSLVKQFFGTAGVQLLSKAIVLVSGIIFARYLGPEQYGLYGYAMSILVLFTLPVTAGLPNLIIREIAKFQLEKKWASLVGMINWSRYYVLSISAISMLVLAFLLYIDFFDSNITPLLVIAIFLIPFRGLLTQQGAILNGLRKPVFAQIPSTILSPLLMLFVLLFFIFNQYELTGELLVKVGVIGAILAFTLSALFVKKTLKQEIKIVKPNYKIKEWQKSLSPFMLMAIVSTLNTELAVLFLGYFDNSESVAFFKVAVQGTALVALGLGAINAVIMPQVARLYKQGDLKQTQQLLTKSVRLSCLVSLPIIAVLMIFGDFFIELFFGKEYLPAYPVLVILCVGQAVNVMMGSVGLVLNMTNNEKSAFCIIVTVLIITILLMSIIIPLYDVLGAAVVSSISIFLWNIFMALAVYRKTTLLTWLVLYERI